MQRASRLEGSDFEKAKEECLRLFREFAINFYSLPDSRQRSELESWLNVQAARNALLAVGQPEYVDLNTLARNAPRDEVLRHIREKIEELQIVSPEIADLHALVVYFGGQSYPLPNWETAGDTPSDEDLSVEQDLKKLKEILKRLPVAETLASSFIEEIESQVANAGRATWKPDPSKPDAFVHLRHLTAPAFIKIVWKDKIRNGRIMRDEITAYDKALLQAYDVYVSSRKSRGLDRGEAKGLLLISSRKLRSDFHP